jgi:D-glycero-alpha-D-manno-heptose-7-phosphate kinase
MSFFGGGTDIAQWYSEHGGEILSTSINHYNYITLRYLPPFHADHKNRISWSLLEYPEDFDGIQHNAIKAALKHYGVRNGVELSNLCDLPARSGLGTSSSFCAGLIKAIYALKGEMVSKYALAMETIKLEREILGECGGIQDQIAAVYGGLNRISINRNGSFSVEPVVISAERRAEFNDRLLLFFTGISRTSSDVQCATVKSAAQKTAELARMQAMVAEAAEILSNPARDLDDFGRMLDETWRLKRGLSDKISTSLVDESYAKAMKAGALGGKLLGAGGGGFMLFFAPKGKQESVKAALGDMMHVSFKIDDQGCQTILFAPKEYPDEAYERRDYIHLLNSKANEK